MSQFSLRARDNKCHYVNNKKTEDTACDRLNIQENAYFKHGQDARKLESSSHNLRNIKFDHDYRSPQIIVFLALVVDITK